MSTIKSTLSEIGERVCVASVEAGIRFNAWQKARKFAESARIKFEEATEERNAAVQDAIKYCEALKPEDARFEEDLTNVVGHGAG